MEASKNLLIGNTKGMTNAFTFIRMQGPKPRFIKMQTWELVVCQVVDVTTRNSIRVTLLLCFVSQTDG